VFVFYFEHFQEVRASLIRPLGNDYPELPEVPPFSFALVCVEVRTVFAQIPHDFGFAVLEIAWFRLLNLQEIPPRVPGCICDTHEGVGIYPALEVSLLPVKLPTALLAQRFQT